MTSRPAATAVLCVDCHRPTMQRPRCPECERRNPTPRPGYDWTWTKIRRAFLSANPNCAKCGRKATQVDHITRKGEGGTNQASNLQSLCDRCHAVKTKRERRDALHASQG